MKRLPDKLTPRQMWCVKCQRWVLVNGVRRSHARGCSQGWKRWPL